MSVTVCVCAPTLSPRSSLARAAPLLLFSLMDGDRSRFLMRLRMVPPPSAAIAPCSFPASCTF